MRSVGSQSGVLGLSQRVNRPLSVKGPYAVDAKAVSQRVQKRAREKENQGGIVTNLTDFTKRRKVKEDFSSGLLPEKPVSAWEIEQSRFKRDVAGGSLRSKSITKQSAPVSLAIKEAARDKTFSEIRAEYKKNPAWGAGCRASSIKIPYEGAYTNDVHQGFLGKHKDGVRTLSNKRYKFRGGYGLSVCRTASFGRSKIQVVSDGRNLPVLPKGISARTVGGSAVTFSKLLKCVDTNKYPEHPSSAGFLPQMCHVVAASFGLPQGFEFLDNLVPGSKYLNDKMSAVESRVKDKAIEVAFKQKSSPKIASYKVSVDLVHPESDAGKLIIQDGISRAAEARYKDKEAGECRLSEEVDRKISVCKEAIDRGDAWVVSDVKYDVLFSDGSQMVDSIGPDPFLYLSRVHTKPGHRGKVELTPLRPGSVSRDEYLKTPKELSKSLSEKDKLTPMATLGSDDESGYGSSDSDRVENEEFPFKFKLG
ncbi:hypothetical protein DID77_02030 [Candidatus Marinamargulisbacteria bacterium SCGC AG-439-L15]|nr:hypothetical protein DID77_02030 [Candidatus Marinamargulisbacteria bacterium SCGC AG-439-L15]